MTAVVFGTVPPTRLRLTRRGRMVFSVLLVIPALIGAAFLGLNASPAVAEGSSAPVSMSYVTIQPGESLWAIAEGIAPGEDPRDVIAEILSLNGLTTAEVVAGARLAVPVYE